MGIFGGYRADRLIAEVRESGDPTTAKAKAALTKLQGLGQNAIKPIVDALATADKRETVAFVEVLTPLVDNKTFPLLAKALAEENPRAVAGVAWALASSRNYSPGLLLDLPQKYDEMAREVRGRLESDFGKYGAELVDLLINRITPPEEVQRMIDSRGGMSAVGNLDDFLKITSIFSFGPSDLRRVGPPAIAIARAEGLEAHARAIEVRLEDLDGA